MRLEKAITNLKEVGGVNMVVQPDVNKYITDAITKSAVIYISDGEHKLNLR